MDLVLNAYGTTLSRNNANFQVLHQGEKQMIHPSKVKSISISKGAKITSDAALLAIEYEIDVFFIDNSGNPSGRLWSVKYGSVSTIRRKQIDFSLSTFAVKWIKDIICEKIDNQVALLLALEPPNTETEQYINQYIKKLQRNKSKIAALPNAVISDIAPSLRGWEGAASKWYFKGLQFFIPTDLQFENRSQHPAKDPVNCMLNYAYGILYGKIEAALIKAGIDPYVGVFHREDYNRPVLVFDVIEKYRIWADYVVISIASQNVIDDDFFSINNDGSYWLEGLGKRVLIQSMNDYLEEIILKDSLERTRNTHIQLYAHKLAKKFLAFK
jgi:CRISPR-associated protein Cas1